MAATGWNALDGLLAARGVRFGAPTSGQTTGGRHAHGSWHYSGLARDYGQANSDLAAVLVVLTPMAVGAGAPLTELFGLGTFYDNGRRFTPSAELRADHQDHVHAAVRAGVTLEDLLAFQPTAAQVEASFARWVAGGEGEAPAAPTGGASAGGLAGAVGAVGAVASALLSGDFWRRVGLGLAGLAVLVFGFVLLNRDLVAKVGKAAL